MKSKFFPRFALITIIAITLLVVTTQLLGFKPNVSSVIAEFFVYGVSYKFILTYVEKRDNNNKLEDIHIFIKRYVVAIFVILITVSFLSFVIGKIFSLNLRTEGMAAYTALILGYLLGIKFVKFFSKRLFEEKDEEEKNLDLGEDVEKDTAHIC